MVELGDYTGWLALIEGLFCSQPVPRVEIGPGLCTQLLS